MKIIQINLQDGWRGGEQQLGYLMLELKKRNIELFLICKKDSELEKFAKDNSFNYLSLKLGVFRKYINAKKIIEFVNINKIDIIHCNESRGLGLTVLSKILFKNKTKLLLHRHVIFPIKGFISKNIKYSPKYIDKTICVSRKAESVFKKTTYNTNVSVIPAMTDVHFPYSDNNILGNEYGIDRTKKIIGYIAALTFEKDHFTFLDTAKKICQKNTDTHFVIIGSGKLEDNIKKYSKDLDLDSRVSFLGYVNQANRLIPEMDLMLLTSTQEGFGATIIDSFVAKTPVISVKNGGSEDIIMNNENGILCNIKDIDCLSENAIQLLSDENLCNIITENAHKYAVENYSIEEVSTKIYNTYLEILKS